MSHLDAHIANLQAEREAGAILLENLMSALLFSETSSEWLEVALGDAFDVRDGTHESPKYVDDGLPLLTSKNLTSGEISLEGAKLISKKDFDSINVRSRVDVGDLLMAMIGTIGNVCVVDVEPTFAVKNVAIFKSRTQASTKLLYYFLRSSEIGDRFQSEAKGSTQRFVSLGYLRNLRVRFPPPEVADGIVKTLDAGRSVVVAIDQELLVLQAARNRLLSALVSQQLTLQSECPTVAGEVA